MRLIVFAALFFIQRVTAHVAAFDNAMYCLNDLENTTQINARRIVDPMYFFPKSDWWMRGPCKDFPPKAGVFLELPAGGSFTVEISANKGQTTLSNNGADTSDWPDGNLHPEDLHESPGCITQPNLHCQNQSMAAGTAFAIAYNSDIYSVTMEEMTVFSILPNTPWKRIAIYQVPAALPACPPDGCICSWGWVPNGCGIPNSYQNPFRCKVTGATSTIPVGRPQPPVWCEDDQSKCIKGPKQLIAWNQNEGNNIEVDGYDLAGELRSPAYNTKCGFSPGAQNDIFEGSPQVNPNPVPTSTPTPLPSSSDVPVNTPVPSPSDVPTNTPPPVNNATMSTTTTTSFRSRPSRCVRSTVEEAKLVKKSIAEGVASHLRRRRLAQRST